MARDSTVGQKRVVMVPGGPLDGGPIPNQAPDDISQEILEVKRDNVLTHRLLYFKQTSFHVTLMTDRREISCYQ